MRKLDDWAAIQWAGIKQAASGTARDIMADTGNTYQAFLMGDAGWRVPRAHGDVTASIAEKAAMDEVEEAIAAQHEDVGIDYNYC